MVTNNRSPHAAAAEELREQASDTWRPERFRVLLLSGVLLLVSVIVAVALTAPLLVQLNVPLGGAYVTAFLFHLLLAGCIHTWAGGRFSGDGLLTLISGFCSALTVLTFLFFAVARALLLAEQGESGTASWLFAVGIFFAEVAGPAVLGIALSRQADKARHARNELLWHRDFFSSLDVAEGLAPVIWANTVSGQEDHLRRLYQRLRSTNRRDAKTPEVEREIERTLTRLSKLKAVCPDWLWEGEEGEGGVPARVPSPSPLLTPSSARPSSPHQPLEVQDNGEAFAHPHSRSLSSAPNSHPFRRSSQQAPPPPNLWRRQRLKGKDKTANR